MNFIKAKELKPRVRYVLYVNDYSTKGTYARKKDALKMFRIMKSLHEKGTRLTLYKGWVEPTALLGVETMIIKECIVK